MITIPISHHSILVVAPFPPFHFHRSVATIPDHLSLLSSLQFFDSVSIHHAVIVTPFPLFHVHHSVSVILFSLFPCAQSSFYLPLIVAIHSVVVITPFPPLFHFSQIEPFHRVFRRPLSLLRADPTPLVAPTVLNRASDGGRRQSTAPLPSAKDATQDNTIGNPSAGGGGGGGGGWTKRGLTFAGSGGLGIALGGGEGGGTTSGVKKGMAKLKKGLRKASARGGGKGGGGGAAAVAMSGVGVDDSGPQTVRQNSVRLHRDALTSVFVIFLCVLFLSVLCGEQQLRLWHVDRGEVLIRAIRYLVTALFVVSDCEVPMCYMC